MDDGLLLPKVTFLQTHKNVGDVGKALAGHCYRENKVLGSDARLTYHCRYPSLVRIGQKGPDPALKDIHGGPIYGHLCLLNVNVFGLKMFYKSFELRDNIFHLIFRLFRASSILSMVTPINFRVFTWVVSREIILVL